MTSLRQVLLDGLYDLGEPVTTNGLFEKIKVERPMSLQDLVRQTWGCQKAGELTFKERKGQAVGDNGDHHGGDLVDIHLTGYGIRVVEKRRGTGAEAPYDRPFIKVTMDELLAGIGMKPIEKPEEPSETRIAMEILERVLRPIPPTGEDVVTGQILAESVGGKLVEKYDAWDPSMKRGFVYRPANKNTATDKGRHPVGKDMTDSKHHGQYASGGPIEKRKTDRPIPAPVVPPANDPYPLLSAMRVSLVKRGEAQARAETLLNAAAMIEAIAPDQAEELQRRADNEVAPYTMNALQAEYLLYADEHR